MTHRYKHIRLFALVALVVMVWLPASTLAQSPITATVDREVIGNNEQVRLTVTVIGDLANVPIPEFTALEDFTIVGSSQSIQTIIINGEVTAKGEFSYQLKPLSDGTLTIAPLQIDMNGQIFQTDPITIEVLGSSAAPPEQNSGPQTFQGQDFFVEAEVDNTNPYLGQQIIYTFRLYQGMDFFGSPDYRPPPFINFLSTKTLSQPNYTAEVFGRNYFVTEIRTGLFPANIGEITIDPAKLVIPGGFLEPDIVLETQPIEIMVKSLPDDAPPDFMGAVGDFEISAELSETEGHVNEPLTLIIEVSGQGNVEFLAEPELPEIEGWRTFESQSPQPDIQALNDVVFGTRRYERLIVPGRAGDTEIPPISLSYYNPTLETYETVRTDPIPVSILPGEAEPAPQVTIIDGADKQPVTVIAGDIRHIKSTPLALTGVITRPIVAYPVYWVCWILPAVGVVAVWSWRRQRERLMSDKTYVRRQEARRKALLILNQHAGEGDYAAAHRALLSYLSDKLDRPTAGLTNQHLINELYQARLSPTMCTRVKDLLEQVEIGRFAPLNQAAAQSMLTEAKQLIDDLEKAFK